MFANRVVEKLVFFGFQPGGASLLILTGMASIQFNPFFAYYSVSFVISVSSTVPWSVVCLGHCLILCGQMSVFVPHNS
jgi:hypothetical protein